MITSDIPTGKGGGEKANYFIIIVHLLSSVIIGSHHLKCGFDSRRLHQFICNYSSWLRYTTLPLSPVLSLEFLVKVKVVVSFNPIKSLPKYLTIFPASVSRPST